jgi:ubiquinol-cytochrome c reductase iron-sulfur subunit
MWAGVAVGTQLTVLFLGKPVFIRHRTEEEIAAAREVPLEDLVDQDARNANMAEADASDENRSMPTSRATTPANGWSRSASARIWAACPSATAQATSAAGSAPATARTTTGSGRIRRGPAPENLPIPAAEFVDETTILLG